MNALEAILSRRSVRRYTNEQIDAETAQKLLAAAMNAPELLTNRLLTGVYLMDVHVAGFAKCGQLPKGVAPLALVVVGHRTEQPPTQNRFSEHKVHSNGWSRCVS